MGLSCAKEIMSISSTVCAQCTNVRLYQMAQQDVDYIERLTGMRTDELVEVSQDRETGRELDPQPPD